MSRRIRLSLLRLFALTAFLCFGTGAIAQWAPIERQMSPEQFQAAGLGKLSPEELANLNAWLAREQAAPVAAGSPAQSPATGRPREALLGASSEPVRSRLKGSVQEWAPGTVFELENGQRWRVVKGSMKLNKPVQAPEIEVAPGMMGRWFLQVDEDAPRARVERIE